MSDPSPYVVTYSFSGFQANNPTTPLPAGPLDNEHANIATAIAAIVSSIKDVRRPDGSLQNGIVTLNSLTPGLQLTIDPTNGTLVAAAVATAQAAQTAASGSATAAGTSATNSANSAAAAAASASGINLALYLPKAGNLAGMGSPDTALSNINAAKNDGTNAVGRLAPITSTTPITDWNLVVTNGWFSATSAANQPPSGANDWVAHVIAQSALWITQIAYPYSLGSTSTSAVTPYRRQGYNNSGVIAWQPWESQAGLPVGSTIWVNATAAPAGFLKENGALISRASFPALYAFANASGNIVSEASWSGGSSGAFSTGDLSTTFRLPDARGQFFRAYDDSRGVDSGRVLGAAQADSLKDHTHIYQQYPIGNQAGNATGYYGMATNISANTATGSPSTGAALETRPKNNAKLACIKF